MFEGFTSFGLFLAKICIKKNKPGIDQILKFNFKKSRIGIYKNPTFDRGLQFQF